MSSENTLAGSNQPETPDHAPEVEATEAEGKEQRAAAETESSESEKSEAASEDAESEGKKKSSLPQWVQDLRRDKRNLSRQLARAHKEIGRLKAEAPPAEEDVAANIRRAAQEVASDGRLREVTSGLEELQVRQRQVWESLVEDAAKRIPDFAQVISNPSVPVTDLMFDEIMETDAPAEVAYFLCKNPAEAHRIAALSEPRDVIRAIQRLESRLTPPKAKHVSSAPKPVPTVAGKATQTVAKDPKQLASNMEDYAAYWHKREGLSA